MARDPVLACGLYRTGTNYTQKLIDRNLDVTALYRHPVTGKLPYKHSDAESHVESFYPELRLVFTHKPVDKWMDSLCRQSFDLIDYHDLRWETGHDLIEIAYDDDECSMSEERRPRIPCSVQKLCGLYTSYFEFWMKNRHRWPHLFSPHLEATLDPQGFVDKAAWTFGCGTWPYRPLDELVPGSRRFDDKVVQTYQDPDWFQYLDGGQVDLVRRLVPDHVKEFLKGNTYLKG